MALFDKKDDIFKLMEKFEKSAIMELEVEAGEGMKIKLSKFNPAQPPVYLPGMTMTPNAQHTFMHHAEDAAAPIFSGASPDPVVINANEPAGSVIKAPIIGTFYSAASPEAEPYVKVGDKVAKGAIICILEAMKVMNEIECEQDCEIVEILANNGDQIEYNQPLFKIK